jgi:galactonate dehydratase
MKLALSRRALLGLPVGLLAQRLRLTIHSLEAFSIPVNHRGDWLIFRIKGSNGATGVGDASHGGTTAAKLPILREMFGLVRGQPADDVARLHRAVRPLVHRYRTPAAIVWGGIEQCLWDLIGKAAGLPVHAMLGGKLRHVLPQYANINRSTVRRTPDGFAEQARKAVQDGFSAVKLAPWDGMPKGPDAAVRKHTELGIASVAAVRYVIGPERHLLVDGHGHFDQPGALELARRLDRYRLYWLEETCPSRDLAALAAVNAAAPMQTAGGEASYGLDGFRKLIDARAFDTLMPDIKYCGGLLECFRIAAAAEAAGLPIAPHGPASPVGNVAAAHVCAAIPNFAILEFAHGEVPWRAEVVEPAETLRNGDLPVPDKPGIGIQLNESLLQSRASRVAQLS